MLDIWFFGNKLKQAKIKKKLTATDSPFDLWFNLSYLYVLVFIMIIQIKQVEVKNIKKNSKEGTTWVEIYLLKDFGVSEWEREKKKIKIIIK